MKSLWFAGSGMLTRPAPEAQVVSDLQKHIKRCPFHKKSIFYFFSDQGLLLMIFIESHFLLLKFSP